MLSDNLEIMNYITREGGAADTRQYTRGLPFPERERCQCRRVRREGRTLPEGVVLTEEQEETRLGGLRILARMIVRAYLRDLARAEGLDEEPLPTLGHDSFLKEERDVA